MKKYTVYVTGSNQYQIEQIKNEIGYGFNINISPNDEKNINLLWDQKYFKLSKSDILLVVINVDQENQSDILMEISRAYSEHKPIIVAREFFTDLEDSIKYHASIACNCLDTALDCINTYL